MNIRCVNCTELYDDSFNMCPHCGYCDGDEAEEPIHIAPGTILHNRYVVGKVVGSGGFGVTYIGWDGKLERKIAIKEYFPGEFSTRMPGQSVVTVFNDEKHEQFYDGMNKFIDEARRLAKFQSENGIVKIFDSFTENETAYIIMEYLEGETLVARLEREDTIPEKEAVEMLMPVMNSLKAVHAQGIIHRDIAPDNIFITSDGDVKLIDFGASRYATTSHSRSLTVVIKQGYSPEEQYRSRGDQGPHTDVYALAATLYRMITGKVPPDAMERRSNKEGYNKEILVEPHIANKSAEISRVTENAILNALNVRIEDRTPDIPSFIAELTADKPAKRRAGKIKKIDVYRWPLWLKIVVPSLMCMAVIFGGLLLTGVISFKSPYTDKIVTPDGYVTVPDVESLYHTEAVEKIQECELIPMITGNVASEYVEAGKIILQTPIGDSYSQKNSTIELVISSGEGVIAPSEGVATMPFIIGDPEEDGIEKLEEAGLAYPDIEYEFSEMVKEGCIISASEKAGTQLDEGTVISMTVSLGQESFTVPDITGKTEEEATDTLNELKLLVTAVYKNDDTSEPGTVIEQSIGSGEEARPGDAITITVATEDEVEVVPNVIGLDKDDAAEDLADAGFKISFTNSGSGRVIRQTPEGGESMKKGSTIVLTLETEQSEDIQNVETENNDEPEIQNNNHDNNDEEKPQSVTTKKTETTTKPVSDKVTVPDLVGKYGSHAMSDLQDLGFKVDVTDRSSDTVEIGYVISQSPSAGSKASKGSTVELVISTGSDTKMTTVDFDPNGGTVDAWLMTVEVGSTYGELPIPTRDYYDFTGWYTSKSGGTQITSSSIVSDDSEITIYAHWSEHEVSDWVPENEVPDGAKTVNEKWLYTYTTFTESWEETDSGTYYYGSFPAGYNSDDQYYGWNRNQLEAFDNGSTKREVGSPEYNSHVFWHWSYYTGAGSENNRLISDTYNEAIYNSSGSYRGRATIWEAFESTEDGSYNGDGSYMLKGYSSESWHWFRIDIYRQSYKDYQKVTNSSETEKESSTAVTENENISNVRKYVKYRAK